MKTSIILAAIFASTLFVMTHIDDRVYANVHHNFCDGSTVIYEKAKNK